MQHGAATTGVALDSRIVGAFLVADALTALSYLAIAITIALLVYRLRSSLPFSALFVLFGAFIVLCGATHFFGLLAPRWPLPSISVVVSVATAIVSAVTAWVLARSMPQILAFVMDAKVARARERDHARAEALAASNVELARQASALTDALRERDALETQLRQSQKMEVLGLLASGVAHDFNNLLTVIKCNVDIARDDLAGRPEAALLGDVQRATASATELTKRLLAFGRQDVDARSIADLDALIGDDERLYRGALPRAISLELRLRSEGAKARINCTQIEQAVLNLVVNARDAAGERGSVTITTGRVVVREVLSYTVPPVTTGAYATISVRDTGTGIAPDIIPRLFEPFFTTKAEGKGTGLGLAMVYDAALQHAGGVSVQSTVGEGSLFTLYLPLLANGSTSTAVIE